jgi:hypothetical protein
MKICSYSSFEDFPESKTSEVIEWIMTNEFCNEYVYLNFRVPQSQQQDNWFKNIKLIKKEEQIDLLYGNKPYYIYHISYEKKHEYFVIEIADNPDALAKFLSYVGDWCGLVYRDDKFWLDLME